MTVDVDPTAGVVVTEPGVYEMSDADYFADPIPGGSLSATGAKSLLANPAIFKWARDNGRAEKRTWDFGKAAHAVVLGRGAELVVVEAENWRTKAAQDKRDEAYAEGKTPILISEHAVIKAMAEQLRAHPLAPLLFDGGRTEQALIGVDDETGTWLRSKLDHLPDPKPGRRLLIADYKSTTDANPARFGKHAFDFGYHIQAPFYLSQIHRLGIAEDAAFLFVNQEKTAPYLVSITTLDDDAMALGRDKVRRAIDLYAQCVATDTWPSWPDHPHTCALPNYAWRDDTSWSSE